MNLSSNINRNSVEAELKKALFEVQKYKNQVLMYKNYYRWTEEKLKTYETYMDLKKKHKNEVWKVFLNGLITGIAIAGLVFIFIL